MSALLAMEIMPETMIGGMTERRLDFHMRNWAGWMRGREGADWYPSKSSGFVGGGYSQTFDDMCLSADSSAARATDALIESLSPSGRAAIHHTYLHAVYRFPRGDFNEVVAKAMARIGAGLLARGFV